LHISNIVYGREHREGKVFYFCDPSGLLPDKAIPEQVVLWRWRRRSAPANYSFSGDRLSPNVWRAMEIAFPDGQGISPDVNTEELQVQIESARAALRAKNFSLPSAECLQAMFRALGTERVRLLTARHNAPERAERYGTPDLFLYMAPTNTGLAPSIRFVEVKKPGETISPDQREEIAFLNSIGVPARVLRLIERN
jgi:hypothetical protein